MKLFLPSILMTDIVSMEEFKKALEEKSPRVRFIDVRNPDEYAGGHIAGVENIPIDTLADHLDDLRALDAVYVHCKAGGRATKACELLEGYGLPNLKRMDGGFDTWTEAGNPAERS